MRAVAIVVLVVLAAVAPVAAQRRSVSDARIVEQATLVASGDHVELYQHGVTVAPVLLKAAEDAYRRLETLTGRALDTATGV